MCTKQYGLEGISNIVASTTQCSYRLSSATASVLWISLSRLRAHPADLLHVWGVPFGCPVCNWQRASDPDMTNQISLDSVLQPTPVR